MSTEIERLVKQWDRIHNQTVKVMKAAPSEKLDWKPAETIRSLGSLLRHIVSAEHFLITTALTGQGQPPTEDLKGYDVAGLVDAFNRQHQRLVEQVASLSPEQSKETIQFFGRELPRMTLLWGITEHEIHHRGQLFVYLRLLGVEPPSLYD
jgi:uncharacterized damage-inducible protein DinB